MTKTKKLIVSVILVGSIAIACFAGVLLFSSFGPPTGNVHSLTKIDSSAKTILEGAFCVVFPSKSVIRNVSMVSGKDSTLYAVIEMSPMDAESFLKSISFPRQDGRPENVQIENPALPWWKIERAQIETIVRASDGYTAAILVRNGESRRVFLYTDGGPSGFSRNLWDLFK